MLNVGVCGWGGVPVQIDTENNKISYIFCT